ncbi:hypothetical protein FPV67DRAFT_101100 [Lyophyllum atratum]|nr:hypothetical protein FPV67DRAFT_101100 [Lyophyllum atratum]
MQAESSKMGASRPTRTRKKRKSDSTVAGDPEKDYEDSKEIIRKAPKKRRATGKLAGLIDLPIDVLFEIFSHLKPYDLLKLARMSKEFRRLLMHKSSKSVWKSALERIPDLPACPSEMSEPAWVNLAFDPHCHFCFTTGVRPVEWALRVRICTKCAKDQIEEVYLLEGIMPVEPTPNFPCETLLPSRLGKRGRRGILISELEKTKLQYDAIEGKDARRDFILERRKIMSEIQKHASLCSKWAQGQTFDRSSELQQLKNDRRLAIIEKLAALGYAEDVAGIRFPDALEEHELVRKPQKLTDRVWANIRGPIIEFMDRMRVKRLAREHAELVLERKPSAVEAFRGYKNSQLPLTEVMPEGLDICDFAPVKAILEQPANVTVDKDSFAVVLPLIPDLIVEWRRSLDDELIRVIKAEDANDRIRRAKRRFASACMFWSEYHDYSDDEDLTPQPQQPPLDEATPSDRLKLATTVFQCTTCTRSHGLYDDSSAESDYGYGSEDSFFGYTSGAVRPLFYPTVMGHRCLTRSKPSLWSWGPPPEPARKLENTAKTRRKWMARPLRINQKLGRGVETLVTLANLDPKVATPADMDGVDVWFACLKCAFKVSKKKNPYETHAYKWRDAVEHQSITHRHVEPQWKKLDAEEYRQAQEEYETNTESSRHNTTLSDHIAEGIVPSGGKEPDSSDASWLCVHCRDTPSEMEPVAIDVIKTHVNEKHSIEDPELDRDYYRDYAALHPVPPRSRVVLTLDPSECKAVLAF